MRSSRVGVWGHRSFQGEEFVQQEIAIHDFPMRSEPFTSRTRVGGSRGVGVRHIGVFGVVKLMHNGIAIRDFPTRERSRSIGGTRVPGSEGVGIRYFEASAYKGTDALEIMISRYPIELTRASGIGNRES
jgi:hypothetical protein